MKGFDFPDYPSSEKVYVVSETNSEIKVPFREITLSDTPVPNTDQFIPNEPIRVYDTSGPYTDSNVEFDLKTGLPKLRAPWVKNRTGRTP